MRPQGDGMDMAGECGQLAGDCSTCGQHQWMSMGWSRTQSPESGQLLSCRRCVKELGGVQGAAGDGLHKSFVQRGIK